MNHYCITLKTRPERLAMALDEFERQSIDAIIYTATKKSPGWVGCRESHLSVMEIGKGSAFVVFEDDVVFMGNYNDMMGKALSQLPSNWDILYLGASPQEKMERYSENLLRIGRAWCLHAVVYNNTHVVDYILDNRDKIEKIDVFYSEFVNRQFNCFVLDPILCTQYQTKSDTCGRSDTSTIVKNFDKYRPYAI